MIKDEILRGGYDADDILRRLSEASSKTRGRSLIWAVQGNSADLVRSMLTAGGNSEYDINAKDEKGRTALMHAVGGKDMRMHEQSAKFEQESKMWQKKLEKGSVDLTMYLSQIKELCRGLQREARRTTLYDHQIAHVLIGAGANVDLVEGHGYSALHFAVWVGNKDGVSVLISSKADLNAQDKDGSTALSHASSLGQADVVRALVDAGADLNIQEKDGCTALLEAAITGQADVVRLREQRVSTWTPRTLRCQVLTKENRGDESCEHRQPRPWPAARYHPSTR
jgi:ankyrin repeat protein